MHVGYTLFLDCFSDDMTSHAVSTGIGAAAPPLFSEDQPVGCSGDGSHLRLTSASAEDLSP